MEGGEWNEYKKNIKEGRPSGRPYRVYQRLVIQFLRFSNHESQITNHDYGLPRSVIYMTSLAMTCTRCKSNNVISHCDGDCTSNRLKQSQIATLLSVPDASLR